MNRRGFVAAAGAVPLAAAAFSSQSTASEGAAPLPSEPGYGPWLEIDRQRLSWNIDQMSSRINQRPILAVVKNNAYGHGAAGTAGHLESLQAVWGLAVFKPSEALELRDAGIRKPVLVFSAVSDRQLEELVSREVTPSIFSDQSATLIRLAEKLGRPVPIHLYVDTGLGRQGVPYHRALPLAEKLAESKGIRFDGVLTALTEDSEFDREQVRRLQELCDQAAQRGIDLGRRHAASSSGVFHCPEAHLDMVRPGIGIYGCYPDDASLKAKELTLKPALSLKVKLVQVKRLRRGDSLQYHRVYKAEQPVWIATLPVGYSDGWPSSSVNASKVLIRGKEYPVVASVTSNHTLVELGPETNLQPGDTAT
ncbi:MAG: alanine racemase, partial [Acidobacteriota bacterium]